MPEPTLANTAHVAAAKAEAIAASAPVAPGSYSFDSDGLTVPDTEIGKIVELGATVNVVNLPIGTSGDVRKSVSVRSATTQVAVNYNSNAVELGTINQDTVHRFIAKSWSGTHLEWEPVGLLRSVVETVVNAITTFIGAKDFQGQVSLTGQSASSGTDAMNRSLVDSLLASPNVLLLKDDFFGSPADSTQGIGELNWAYLTSGVVGDVRPWQALSSKMPFGNVGLVTGAGRRSSIRLNFDSSSVLGTNGFSPTFIENSDTRIRFNFYVDTLDCSLRLGMAPYSNTGDFKGGRFFGLNYAKAAPAWVASTAYSVGEFARPTALNGRRYYATVAGSSDGVEPTWPVTAGGTVVDGGVTWKEYGRDGTGNLEFLAHHEADELTGSAVDTGVTPIAGTVYDVEMRWVSGRQWALSVDGGAEVNVTLSSISAHAPVFAIESDSVVAETLYLDYFILFSRITR